MSSGDFINIGLNSLAKATKLENESKYNESLDWYEEGLGILINAMKLPDCGNKILEIKRHTIDYLQKAERLKETIDKENKLDQLKLSPGQHQQIKIEKNSTGHSYHSIFTKFLVKGDVTEVSIEDPYIRDAHQISNFVCFCEMLVKSRSKVLRINLLTSSERSNSQEQLNALELLRCNLRNHSVTLEVRYSGNLHDREIRFSNGWIVKIGRGLDYFKRLPHDHVLGFHDFDFRPCLETTIDIFHKHALSDAT